MRERVLGSIYISIMIRMVRRMYASGEIITDGREYVRALRADPVRRAIDWYERPRGRVEY